MAIVMIGFEDLSSAKGNRIRNNGDGYHDENAR